MLLESNGQIDPSTENWTTQQIADVTQKVKDGINWWKELLAAHDSVHELNFHFDVQTFSTKYEPISRVSQDYKLWVKEFLDSEGFGNLGAGDVGISKGIRYYNNQQRIEKDQNWSFTIFVVDADNDGDGRFAPGSNFSRSFAFTGGRFFVIPSNRPASAFAHEMGHIFYAYDEYDGSVSYTAHRGYYNTQNLNGAYQRPASAGDPVPSIMARHDVDGVFANHLISPSAMEMVGWRDSDGDGIFDALDVPLSLTGSGAVNPATGKYRFVGHAGVGVLPNLNQSSLLSDVTINEVSRIQYRIDGGAWTDALEPHAYEVDLDFSLTVPAGQHTVQIRALDDATNEAGETGVMSQVFQGSTSGPSSVPAPGINGFIWNDLDGDGVRDASEPAMAGWNMEVRGPQGQPLNLVQSVEPDDYAENQDIAEAHPAVKLTALGTDLVSNAVGVAAEESASTGAKVFALQLPAASGQTVWSTEWTGSQRQLRMEFTEPTTTVSIDAIGMGTESYGRLEIYDADFQPIGRITSGALADGEVAMLTLSRPTAEIKYAVAMGQTTTSVRLDNLRFGPAMGAITDANGAWSIPSLDEGDFQVRVLPPTLGWQATTPGGASRPVALTSGAAVENVTFGFQFVGSPWHNATEPFDVNRDTHVTTLDLISLVSYLRDHGPGELQGQPGANDPRVDVNADNIAAINDVLALVSHLRDQMTDQPAGEQPFAPVPLAAQDLAAPAEQEPDEFAALATRDIDDNRNVWGGNFSACSPKIRGSAAITLEESLEAIAPDLAHRGDLETDLG